MMIHLLRQPCTITELAKLLEIDRKGVEFHVNSLKAAGATFTIVGWTASGRGGSDAAQFVLTMPGETAPEASPVKPRPQTGAEAMRKHRASGREKPRIRRTFNPQKKAPDVVPLRDPMTAALFGVHVVRDSDE